MALTFHKDEGEPVAMYTFKERLWLDADGGVVKDGDVKARSLLGAPGQEIKEERARALGLLKETKAPANKAWKPKIKDDVDDKPDTDRGKGNRG